MARIKSIIICTEIDTALKSHNCQANETHRITKGSIRLKVRNGRSYDYYCINCANQILKRDMRKLNDLQAKIENNQLHE